MTAKVVRNTQVHSHENGAQRLFHNPTCAQFSGSRGRIAGVCSEHAKGIDDYGYLMLFFFPVLL